MVNRLIKLATVALILSFVLKFGHERALAATEKLPVEAKKLSALARNTSDPVKLEWALKTLILIGDKNAKDELEGFLTDLGRLKVLEKSNKPHTGHARLFSVLLSAAENLKPSEGNALFVTLWNSRQYGIGPNPPRGYRVRQDAMILAMGYLKAPSDEFLKILENFLLEDHGAGAFGNPDMIRAVARMNTEEAYAILHKMPYEASNELAPWRDQPRVFEFLVSAYLRGEGKGAKEILPHHILGDEPFWGHGERYPTYYDDVAPEDAAAYVKQLDRLLECKGERELTEEHREKVEGIKSLLKGRAEAYKRMKKREERGQKEE